VSKKILVGVALLAACATSAYGSTCPTTNVVQNPPLFQWTHHPVSGSNPEEYFSGTLEMGQATFNIGGGTVTTRAYRQEGGAFSIPGPTLLMSPGNKYVLRFRNLLPFEPLNPEHNVFKDPNVTNLHTHGVHISGETPADDVTRFFEGQFGGDFAYEILPDHMGGTYWYHAHHHGSTFLQVSSGAFGLLLIDDSLDNVPANVATMTERHLIAAFLDPSVAGTGGDTLITGTLSPTWTLNGTVAGNVCMPPNTWQHWRLLLADRDAKAKTVTVGAGCEVALMARDGVWRTEVPKVLPTNSLSLTGASRADLAVRCSADSTIRVGSTVVGNIFVDGTADPLPHPWAADGSSTWLSQRPTYLRDLRGEAPVNTETVNMGARTINGSKFDENVPTFSLPASGVQEWTLKGATNHPFHLHVYHVQVQSTCGDFEGGEYYDTVAQNCTIRFDLSPATSTVYDGRTTMHCHILEHEDQGAMGWLDVIGGLAPPAYPADGGIPAPYSDYYPLGGGGTPPTAVQVRSITVSVVGIGGGNKIGRALVVVEDDQGGLVSGAVVSGEFTGTIVETVTASDPTDANGLTVIDTTGSAKGSVSVTFCVTAISHPTLEDFSAPPGTVCGSS
jgi:FtsP/CotA-like multicopper oxidase with cupredoxin domain